MATRSVQVEFTNRTRSNLIKVSDRIDHGVWTSRPPQIIGDRASWATESDGFATGTEGLVTYRIEDVPDSEVTMIWDNPFIGASVYQERVAPKQHPQGLDEPFVGVKDGFSIVHLGGAGNNASVQFIFARGLLTVDPVTGELIDQISQPIETPPQVASGRFASVWVQESGPAVELGTT